MSWLHLNLGPLAKDVLPPCHSYCQKTRITRPGAQAYDRPGFNKFRLLGAPHFCCARNFRRPQFAADLEVCTPNVVFDHDSYLITQKMKVCGGLLQIC